LFSRLLRFAVRLISIFYFMLWLVLCLVLLFLRFSFGYLFVRFLSFCYVFLDVIFEFIGFFVCVLLFPSVFLCCYVRSFV